jgi:hypothetical protein
MTKNPVRSAAAVGALAVLVLLAALSIRLPADAGTAAGDTQQGRSGPALHRQTRNKDPRLAKAWIFDRGGWTYVHLEGSPADIGYQHGYLVADKIEDLYKAWSLFDTHRTKHPWQDYRDAAEKILWPHIDSEYQQELDGIVAGLGARGVNLDRWDIVALNAMEEVPDYYFPIADAEKKAAGLAVPDVHLVAPGNCSAFVATGSYTKDHKPVIAHNNWTSFVNGARWRMIFDIVPEKGARIIQDGLPGVIISDDDFGISSYGLVVTETTITGFHGFDVNGKPEFVRARKALQYAHSIDEYVQIMNDGNNGGYANDWLLADRNTGEVARFEQGLKHTRLWRTKDGYFEGSNFASDPDVIKDETDFDVNDMAETPNARRLRWHQLLEENKGKIDVAMAEKFLGDHFDTYEKKEDADERSLCGHGESSPRGSKAFEWAPYQPDGAVEGKATDATMAARMELWARAGHPCGTDFKVQPFLQDHPEFGWMKPSLTDMIAGPWTQFKSGEKK